MSGADRPRPLTELAGWGLNVRARCALNEPETESQVRSSVDLAGTIARGLGRSYGDPALNEDHTVLGLCRLDRVLGFDEETGALTCEAGVSLAEIIRHFAPRGWFPMITPGTKFVTVGGCIASDVHGKAHHAQGSFSRSVDEITVLCADGRIVTASRTDRPDLFWATFGGMGLVGIVLSAKLRLRKIETTYFRQKAIPVRNLEEMVAGLEEHDHAFPYSVATLDVFAKGAQLGRGILVVGDHARRDELPAALARAPLRLSAPPRVGVPFELPTFTLNRLSLRLVNALIQRIQAQPRAFSHYEEFVYPLDKIGHWNRGYGRKGFTQYQFVVPFEDGLRTLRALLTTILSSGELPFLNILKRLGKASDGPLSFPREGYTFAIDFPIRRNTVTLLRRLDNMVRDAGGRVYLAKDAYLQPDVFRTMYPRVDEWLATKAAYDPAGVFTSNLGRRLRLAS